MEAAGGGEPTPAKAKKAKEARDEADDVAIAVAARGAASRLPFFPPPLLAPAPDARRRDIQPRPLFRSS
eukprot:2193293-Pyramimonas_sp.AAC.1